MFEWAEKQEESKRKKVSNELKQIVEKKESKMWALRVEKAVNRGEEQIQKVALLLKENGFYYKQYKDYLRDKLDAYYEEIERIKEELEEKEQIKVETVIVDILDEFDQPGRLTEMETINLEKIKEFDITTAEYILTHSEMYSSTKIIKIAGETLLKEDHLSPIFENIPRLEKYAFLRGWLETAVEQGEKIFISVIYADELFNYDENWATEVVKDAIKTNPEAVVVSINSLEKYYKTLGTEIRQAAFLAAMTKDPWLTTSNKEEIKNSDLPWVDGVLKIARKNQILKNKAEQYLGSHGNHLNLLINHLPEFHGCYYVEQVILKKAALKRNKGIEHVNKLKGYEWAREVYLKIAKEDPEAVIKKISEFADVEWGGEVIQTCVKENPRKILENTDSFKGAHWAKEVILTAVHMAPITSYFHLDKIEKVFGEKQLAKTDKVLAIVAKTKRHEVLYLIDNIAKDRMTLEEAEKLTSHLPELLTELIGISSQKEFYGGNEIEDKIKETALKLVRRTNAYHNSSEEVRFKSAQNFTSKELYTLIAAGSEEVFTSSFNGIYKRLKSKMEEEGVNGYELLQSRNFEGFRSFLKSCAQYNKLKDFLSTMTQKQKEDVINKVVTGLTGKDKLEQAISVAEISGFIQDRTLLKAIEKKIKEGFEKSESDEQKLIYSLLASVHSENTDDRWFGKMNRFYPFPNLAVVKTGELFSQDRTNYQQYFFYDDRRHNENQSSLWDGHHSFRSFMEQYGVKVSWDRKGEIRPIKALKTEEKTVEDKGSYVVITIKGSDRKKMEIYANKPDHERKGPGQIKKTLRKKGVKSVVVVHRGHSYHVKKTIARIPRITRIVSLGSCGGYKNIAKVLEKAPFAHIIATKGTGTMRINDPLFKMLNDEMLSGGNIDWAEFWQKAHEKLGDNPDFKNYVAPHRNVGTMFVKAYNEASKLSY